MFSTDISVVIPVRNSESTLDVCLCSLLRSQNAVAEVIVVDDSSTDGSANVAERHGANVIRLSPCQGPAAARNAGAAVATGAWLFFLDADVEVGPDTLDRLVEVCRANPSAVAVFGAYDDSPRAAGLVSRYRNLLHHFTHLTACRDAETFWAGCGAIRRDCFLQLGGFDARYRSSSIEDVEFGMRLKDQGLRLVLDSSIQVCHLKRWTLASMIQTDVANRAWPWSRLALRRKRLPNDLNTRWSQRWSAVLTWVGVLSLAVAPWWPVSLATATIAWAMTAFLNRNFLGFLVRRYGVGFTARAFPLHLLYFVYSSATLAVALLIHGFANTRGRRLVREQTT